MGLGAATRPCARVVATAALLAALAAVPASGATTPPPLLLPSTCPSAVDVSKFDSTADLVAANTVMQDFGQRPTGSRAQRDFVQWIEDRLTAMPGMQIKSVPYTVQRWDDHGEFLKSGNDDIPLSGAVPYAASGDVTAPLVQVATGTAISAANAKDKIVVRDAVPGSVPNAAFAALEWFSWDPDLTLTKTIGGNYERDYLNYLVRVQDLLDAAAAGAAGLVFVHGFPRAQVQDQYAPYEGKHWGVPAVYVGVDEGVTLKALAAAGGSAHLHLASATVPADTRTLIATLPGASNERIVVESHTDGMNAIWDNGPIAILAIAKHFASLPIECRARTLQFVFTTGHLYQHLQGEADRGGGAEKFAQQLDQDYDAKGDVAFVMALEHMGAKEYSAVARPGGLPGRVLQQTGESEPTGIFVSESPPLVGAVDKSVVSHDLRRTLVLRGADLPGAYLPIHRSFGGEGTEYEQHMIPTIALVTGPWTLYNPAFGLEAVDGDLLRRQTILFTDLVHDLGTVPREVLGSAVLGERAVRGQICASALSGLGLVNCNGPWG